jgi:hypothetical protein
VHLGGSASAVSRILYSVPFLPTELKRLGVGVRPLLLQPHGACPVLFCFCCTEVIFFTSHLSSVTFATNLLWPPRRLELLYSVSSVLCPSLFFHILPHRITLGTWKSSLSRPRTSDPQTRLNHALRIPISKPYQESQATANTFAPPPPPAQKCV